WPKNNMFRWSCRDRLGQERVEHHPRIERVVLLTDAVPAVAAVDGVRAHVDRPEQGPKLTGRARGGEQLPGAGEAEPGPHLPVQVPHIDRGVPTERGGSQSVDTAFQVVPGGPDAVPLPHALMRGW